MSWGVKVFILFFIFLFCFGLVRLSGDSFHTHNYSINGHTHDLDDIKKMVENIVSECLDDPSECQKIENEE